MRKERALTPRQHRAIELIVAGHNKTKVAAMVGAKRGTLRKWLDKPLFIEALENARIERRQYAAAALDAAVPAAIARLIRLVKDETVRPATQLRAANSILDRAGIMRQQAHEISAKRDLVTLSPSEYAAAKVEEVRGDIAQMRADGKATGIASLHRLEGELMEAHTRALTAESENTEEATDAEHLAELREIVQGLPQAALDQLAEVIESTRKPPGLKVVGGG